MHKKILMLLVFVFWAVPCFAQVDTAWVRRYNGPGNGDDYARSIAVDGSGNVYVTGGSEGSGTGDDYATIKYYPNGDTAWVRRYNGPENDEDVANAIAVDGSGNVYVTGYIMSSSFDDDYATIKYYPDGDTAWVRRYNGPDNWYDYAYAIAVDGSGNVYVTGRSYFAYATIKYYPDGDTAWVRRYNGEASAITVDGSGNVYVTGQSEWSGTTSMDYVTIKYYPDGDTAWVRIYNGPGNDYDRAYAIAVDGSGNVCVTGESYGSGTSRDYATIKYYPDGDTAWVRRYNGPDNGDDWGQGIAVDGSGNVYVTGGSWGSGTSIDYATIKYYANGDTAWLRRYNGPTNYYDVASAIAIDGSGSVYITGYSGTIKYDANGNQMWVGPWGEIDIAVDDSGNVYITGTSGGSGTYWDYATIKYIQFLHGDANGDAVVDVGDVVYLINYLYKSGPPPVLLVAGDTNCDGIVDIGDVVYLINYLYRGGDPPGC